MGIRNRLTQCAITVLMLLMGIFVLFPVVFIFLNAFKSQEEIVASPLSLPAHFNFQYLMNAAEQIKVGSSLLHTVFITVCSVALIIVISSMAAWGMVRSKTKVANIIFLLFTMAMLIPFQALMYPLVSQMDNLGLKNTGGLILMYGGFGLSMSVLLYHGFLKSIPLSLEEAAVIDGANIIQLYGRIVMPLVKPTTVTVVITNAVWIWNDYLLPFLVIGNTDQKTLTLSLYYAKSLSGQYGNPWELIFPSVLICVVPMIIVFILLQRQIIEGVSAGAVKG